MCGGVWAEKERVSLFKFRLHFSDFFEICLPLVVRLLFRHSTITEWTWKTRMVFHYLNLGGLIVSLLLLLLSLSLSPFRAKASFQTER